MTWNEVKTLTWNEISFFKYCDISADTFDLVQRKWNRTINFPLDVEAKLKDLCKPFVREYEKRYKTFDFVTSTKDFVSFLQSLRTLLNMGKEFYPYLKAFVAALFDFLLSLFEK